MIVRNEAETLGRVLQAASQFCDELVIADTGSTDGTQDIALSYGARVLDFPWIDDFAAARNHALEAATSDWVLWLDADDVLTDEVVAAFRALKQSGLDSDLDAIYTPYRYHFNDAGACTMEFNRERLVRLVDGVRWVGRVHEVIHLPGTRLGQRDDLYVEHRPLATKKAGKVDRNLLILDAAVAEGDRSPRTLLYYARELCDHNRYADAIRAFSDFVPVAESTWEHHNALVRMAECAIALGDLEQARARLLDALTVDSTRSEPFLLIGGMHFDKGEWSRALPWYAAAAALPRPRDGFTQPADYSWRPWDYLSVCLINTGRFTEGVDAVMKALELGAPDTERLRKNASWALDQISAS